MTALRFGVNLQSTPGSEAYHEAVEGLNRLLGRLDIIPVTTPVATAAAAIMASLQDGGAPVRDLHDVYIGATARTLELPVLTSTIDHFERIFGVIVVDWSTV